MGSSTSSPSPARHELRSTPVRERRGGIVLYLKQYVRAPGQIGAVAPSSTELSDRLIETIDFATCKSLIEYGPGPGNVTARILLRLRPETNFFAIEANPEMCEVFRHKFPNVKLFEGSAAKVADYLHQLGMVPDGSVDAIVSGLPWAAFGQTLQKSILEATLRVLKPGGQLTTFAYHHGVLLPAGQRFAKTLPQYFSSVSRSRGVLWNLPPAFVYRCVK